MLVHRKKKERYTVQAPLTSLIDIVFLLLVYFLLTTSFMTEEAVTVKLPRANSSAPQTQKLITVFVDEEGRPYLDGAQMTFDDLAGRLKGMIGQEDRPVVIKADRQVILNRAVRVMDIAKEAGASRLLLATEKETGN